MRDRKILERLIKKYGKDAILNEINSEILDRAYNAAMAKDRPKQAERFCKAADQSRKNEFIKSVEDYMGPVTTDTVIEDVHSGTAVEVIYAHPENGEYIVGIIVDTDYEGIYAAMIPDIYDEFDEDMFIRTFTNYNPHTVKHVDVEVLMNVIRKNKFEDIRSARQFVDLICRLCYETGIDDVYNKKSIDWHDFANL